MKILFIGLASLVALGVIGMAIFVYIVQNVETPKYRVVRQEGPFEVRDYPALIVAEVVREGVRRTALSAGFSPLARYIFAKERGGERVAMTAPVTQQAAEPNDPNVQAVPIAMTAPVTQTAAAPGRWQVRFIMPSSYRLDTLPAPAGPDVTLREIPAQRRAAVRFSGRADDAQLAEQETNLRAWLAQQGLTAVGPAEYAYYNDPFTPGFLRRNEVILGLR